MHTGAARLLRESVEWIVRNPSLILVVVILVAYDQATGTDSLVGAIDWTSGTALLTFLVQVATFVLTQEGALALLGTLLVSAALTMLTLGVSFAAFSGKERHLLEGVRTLCSRTTLHLTCFEVVSAVSLYLIFLGCAYSITLLPQGDGLLGALLILFMGAFFYALLFMANAIASLILGAHVSWRHRGSLLRTALRFQNLKRLAAFYATRIGIESALILFAVALTQHFNAPPLVAGLVIVAIVTLPFTLIRTSGFILAFDIYQEDPWFRSYFRAYYERAEQGTLTR